MALYTDNINRVTGLSGVDTESMIDKMMKAESAKYERLQKDKIWTEWRQTAYRDIISNVQNFQEKWFGTNRNNNLGFGAAWNNFTNTVKDSLGNDSTIIKIKNSSNLGKYDLNIIQKAETESLTGINSLNTNISSDKTISEITNNINKYGDASLKFNLDGDVKEIKITASDLASSSLESVLNSKLRSEFGLDSYGNQKVKVDNKAGKLEFSAGDGNSLTIIEGEKRASSSMTQAGVLGSTSQKYELTIDGYTATVDFTGATTEDEKFAKIQEALKVAENSAGDKKDLTSLVTISKSGTEDITISNTSAADELDFSHKLTDSSGTTTDFGAQNLSPTGSLEIFGLGSGASNSINLKTKLTQAFGEDFKNAIAGNPDGIELKFGGKSVFIKEDDTIQSFINKVNDSEGSVKISFNEVTNRFKLEATSSGLNSAINLSDSNTKAFLKNFAGINLDDKSLNDKYIQGKDAIFEVDGIRTTRSSNDINMNGLEFTINGTGSVTIESSSNEDATFNKIKEFIDDYNKLIEGISSKVSETRAKSGEYSYYEPLLDEERKAMSEDEIKKWEEKAKTGLLYRDQYLNDLLSNLRNTMYTSVDIGGKSISLFEIGITTTNDWTKGGKLVIDEDKLRKSIRERGDDISKMFTQTGTGLADSIKKNLNDAVGSNGSLRRKAGISNTASAVNNDLSNELKEIARRIAREKERLYNKEASYFKMFANMENAMNQQNSQMNFLVNLLNS